MRPTQQAALPIRFNTSCGWVRVLSADEPIYEHAHANGHDQQAEQIQQKAKGKAAQPRSGIKQLPRLTRSAPRDKSRRDHDERGGD
jgi:hypothetical protein